MPSSVVLTIPGYFPASICFLRPSPLGPPAISTSVGSQSSEATISVKTVPGLMCPGQRMTIGARMPPSHVFIFEPLNGVVPPSGKVKVSAPLSVVNTTIVLCEAERLGGLEVDDQLELSRGRHGTEDQDVTPGELPRARRSLQLRAARHDGHQGQG